MSTIDDVVAAIAAEDGTSWQIADAVAELPDDDEHGKLTNDRIAHIIHERLGIEWSAQAVSKYRATARAFPPGTRVPGHTFCAHRELRAHPDKLLNWKPKKPGDVLTVERAKALRGRSSVTKPADAARAKLKQLIGQLATIVDEDPVLVLDTLEAALAEWRRSYAKRIERERRRGLTAV